MVTAAESKWGEFIESKNGATLLASEEIPLGEKLKVAFMHGDIMARTDLTGQFIADGLSDFLLPKKRLRWKDAKLPIDIVHGQKLDVLFLEVAPASDSALPHLGHVELRPIEDELIEREHPLSPYLFYNSQGRLVRDVLAYVEPSALVATYI